MNFHSMVSLIKTYAQYYEPFCATINLNRPIIFRLCMDVTKSYIMLHVTGKNV